MPLLWLQSLFIFCLFSFVLTSVMARCRLANDFRLNMALSFFGAHAVFMFLVVILSPTLGFKLAVRLLVCINILIFIVFLCRDKLSGPSMKKPSFENILFIFMGFLLFLFYLSLNHRWGYPTANLSEKHPLETANLLAHSVRAGNISLWIFENNRIPVLGQNSFQSILASAMMVVSNKPEHSQFFLSLLHSSFSSLLAGLIYSILRSYTDWKRAFGATFFVWFTTVSIYPVYVSIVDVGNSFFKLRSIDTIFGIVVFFMLLLAVYFYEYTEKRRAVLFVALGFPLAFSLNLAGVHNSLIVVCIMATAISIKVLQAGYLSKIHIDRNTKWIVCLLISFSLGTATSIPFGGMLSSESMREYVQIYGLMELDSGRAFLSFRDISHLAFYTPGTSADSVWYQQWPQYSFPGEEIVKAQLLSFLLIGLLIIGQILFFVSIPKTSDWLNLFIVSSLLIICAVWISSSLYVHGRLREMTRFLSGPIAIGTMQLGYVLVKYSEPPNFELYRVRTIIIVTLFGLATIPGLSHLQKISQNTLLTDWNTLRMEAQLSFDEQATGAYPPLKRK